MRKIGVLALSLVLAMAVLGVGFALWSETLFIEGTVNTGEVCVNWTQGVPYDDEPVEKDVSHAECSISGNTMTITIYNAYPCITYSIPIDIHNCGTIPVHLCGLVVTSSTLPPDTNIDFPDWASIQLHPSEEAVGVITVHLKNDATENATYTFTAELTAVQWNEACP